MHTMLHRTLALIQLNARLATVMFFTMSVLTLSGTVRASDAQWVQGQHYFIVSPAQKPDVPAGKVEVLEVFSYGCIYCYRVHSSVEKLKQHLPGNAVLNFLPASFNDGESFPLFQRLFYTAQALDLVPKMHDKVFKAVWESRELAVLDPTNRKLMKPQPTIENAADFFQRSAGVNKRTFLDTARSFSVEAKMRKADALVKAYEVQGTPAIIVNGRYRINGWTSDDELVGLVNWLIAKDAK